MKTSLANIILTTVMATSFSALAQNVEMEITENKTYSTVHASNEVINVSRMPDMSNVIDESIAKASRPCPPFCINPLSLDERVKTVAELEVIKFMEAQLYRGDGALVDIRTQNTYKQGTIPGSINIPFSVFEKEPSSVELAEVFESLGVVERSGVNPVLLMVEGFGLLEGDKKTERWDFSHAKELLLWCDDPWCEQSPRAIQGLISAGYPAEKLSYYRGGMQMWQSLGLTTVMPQSESVASR